MEAELDPEVTMGGGQRGGFTLIPVIYKIGRRIDNILVVQLDVRGLTGPLEGPDKAPELRAVTGLGIGVKGFVSVPGGTNKIIDSETRGADFRIRLVGAGPIGVNDELAILILRKVGQEVGIEEVPGRLMAPF